MDIETLVQNIVWGGVFTKVLDAFGKAHCLILRTPTLQDKQFIEFLYVDAINEAQAQGCLTGIELTKDLQRKGVWTHNEEDKIKEIEDRIKSLKESIKEAHGELKKSIINKSVEAHKKSLDELRMKRYDLFSNTAERHAEGVKTRAIVYSSTYTQCDERLWSSWAEFESEFDNPFVQNIIMALNRIRIIQNKDIRKAARSGYWRIQWNAAKSVGDLFGKPIVELNIEQNALVYWSQIYDYIYEHPDRPDDEVVNNDEALDAWFENQDRKKKVGKVTSGESASGVRLGNNIRRHGEIFIVANPAINPNAPRTQDIEDLNDSLTRKFKNKEAERLKKDGKLLKETELRGRKNKIARKLIGSTDAVIKKSSLGGSARGGKSAGKQYPGGTIG